MSTQQAFSALVILTLSLSVMNTIALNSQDPPDPRPNPQWPQSYETSITARVNNTSGNMEVWGSWNYDITQTKERQDLVWSSGRKITTIWRWDEGKKYCIEHKKGTCYVTDISKQMPKITFENYEYKGPTWCGMAWCDTWRHPNGNIYFDTSSGDHTPVELIFPKIIVNFIEFTPGPQKSVYFHVNGNCTPTTDNSQCDKSNSLDFSLFL